MEAEGEGAGRMLSQLLSLNPEQVFANIVFSSRFVFVPLFFYFFDESFKQLMFALELGD